MRASAVGPPYRSGGGWPGWPIRTRSSALPHSPQVAAYADVHLVVDAGGRDATSVVRRLDDDGRVAELARMLAGLGESDTARAHARELLETAVADRRDA